MQSARPIPRLWTCGLLSARQYVWSCRVRLMSAIDCKISLVSCSICSFLLICTPQAGASFPASQRCIGGGADAQVSRRTTIQEQAESTHGPIVGKASCARTCCHLVRLVVCMGPGASTSLAIALSPQLWPLHTISTCTQPSYLISTDIPLAVGAV